jgi:hypothetical protein
MSPSVATFDWRHWARRLLVCNPFFLCSAALLLFGVNRLSLSRMKFCATFKSIAATMLPDHIARICSQQRYPILTLAKTSP